MSLDATPLDLAPEQEAQLLQAVAREFGPALEAHRTREETYAKWLTAYKAKPETDRKMYPWPGASNVVVPLVAITVDALQARMEQAVLPVQTPVICTFKSQAWEAKKKDIEEWAAWFLDCSGARERIRVMAFDQPLYGDVYVKPIWVEEIRTYHQYGADGAVQLTAIPGYVGTKWHVVSPGDVIKPVGFDEWDTLPWFAHRLWMTWPELVKAAAERGWTNLDTVKPHHKQREDPLARARRDAKKEDPPTGSLYEIVEIQGTWEIPAAAPKDGKDPPDPTYEDVILTYCPDANCFLRTIYNPYFGKARHFVKIPYLVQAHEVDGLGAAEVCLPFQQEASTAHNQVIDAATAANAAIIVRSPNCNMGRNEEIYPGKEIVTDDPGKDFIVVHLSESSPVLGNAEQRAAFLAEKRTGVSSYNLGMESGVVGSGATATGTTALISQGNLRFKASISNMKRGIEDLLYLTIQQEQQFRSEGYEFAPGKSIQFPPGDPRTAMGLTLNLADEALNREMEIQNLQVLMGVLNDYYQRLSSAAMLIMNPQFPPPAKQVAIGIMEASQEMVRRFVERFDIEKIDSIVPNLFGLLSGQGAANGSGALAGVPGGVPGGLPPGAPGGFGQMVPSAPDSGVGTGATESAGRSAVSVQ